jgi:hypothetical protein
MGFTLTSPAAQSVRRPRQCLLAGTNPDDVNNLKTQKITTSMKELFKILSVGLSIFGGLILITLVRGDEISPSGSLFVAALIFVPLLASYGYYEFKKKRK